MKRTRRSIVRKFFAAAAVVTATLVPSVPAFAQSDEDLAGLTPRAETRARLNDLATTSSDIGEKAFLGMAATGGAVLLAFGCRRTVRGLKV